MLFVQNRFGGQLRRVERHREVVVVIRIAATHAAGRSTQVRNQHLAAELSAGQIAPEQDGGTGNLRVSTQRRLVLGGWAHLPLVRWRLCLGILWRCFGLKGEYISLWCVGQVGN